MSARYLLLFLVIAAAATTLGYWSATAMHEIGRHGTEGRKERPKPKTCAELRDSLHYDVRSKDAAVAALRESCADGQGSRQRSSGV